MPPELAKELDEETERIIDDWVEQKHTREILKCMVCEAGELSELSYADSLGE